MDDDAKAGLGVALNEATLLGAEMSRERRLAAITFAVLSLPTEAGVPPQDARVSIVLSPVGRVAASLRMGSWDDPAAAVVPFALEDLLKTVQSFGGLSVYGWEFIDVETDFEAWSERLSLDERFGDDGQAHSITLFQEGLDRHLDLRIWFDTLRVFRPNHSEIPIEDFLAAGKRWWDGLYAGDSRTQGHGIFPASHPLPEPPE
jgi:hypothetical protein